MPNLSRSPHIRLTLWILIPALLLFGGGLLFLRNAEHRLQAGIGAALSWSAEATAKRLAVPDPWKAGIGSSVAMIVRDLEAGRLGKRPALRLMRSFDQGPVYLALAARGFEAAVRSRFADAPGFGDEILATFGEFFHAWNERGRPADVAASLSLRLTVEQEELSTTPSGFSMTEPVRVLRQDWDRERITKLLTFLGRWRENLPIATGAVSMQDNDAAQGRAEMLPDPVYELQTELHRLITLEKRN